METRFASKIMNGVEISRSGGEEEKFESNRRLFLARSFFSRPLNLHRRSERCSPRRSSVRSARHQVFSSDRSSISLYWSARQPQVALLRCAVIVEFCKRCELQLFA